MTPKTTVSPLCTLTKGPHGLCCAVPTGSTEAVRMDTVEGPLSVAKGQGSECSAVFTQAECAAMYKRAVATALKGTQPSVPRVTLEDVLFALRYRQRVVRRVNPYGLGIGFKG